MIRGIVPSLGALVLALGLATAEAKPPAELPQPADDTAARFGAREAMLLPALSPDGSKLLYLAAGDGAQSMLMVAPSDGSKAAHVVTSTPGGPLRLDSCDWASDARIVCFIDGYGEDEGVTLEFRQAVSLDESGGIPLPFQKTGSTWRPVQFDAVIDWLHGDGMLLFERDHAGGSPFSVVGTGLGVDLVDTATMASSIVEPAERDADRFLSDGTGSVRMKAVRPTVAGSRPETVVRWSYRIKGERVWRPFSTISDQGPGLRPVLVDGQNDVAYCLDRLDGHFALFSVALDGSMHKRLVYAAKGADIAGVETVLRPTHLIGVDVAGPITRIIYLDPAYSTLRTSLAGALPRRPDIAIVSSSADQSKILLHAGSETDPGGFYLFDKATRKLNELGLVRPLLEREPQTVTRTVRFVARDGAALSASLTLPAGGTSGLPAIVLPRGTPPRDEVGLGWLMFEPPASQDDWGYDWMAQFFAARGFAVLQPDYRPVVASGDADPGFGFRGWRTAASDVVDAGRWLTQQGIADQAKLAVVGWSLNGYLALQAQAVDPDLFKAVIAIAPITDLASMRFDSRQYTSRDLVDRLAGSGPAADDASPTTTSRRSMRRCYCSTASRIAKSTLTNLS